MNIAVVGANRGIGLEFVKQLVGSHQVYAFCRKSSTELEALNPAQIIEGCDVGDEKSIQSSMEKMKAIEVDWLIHVSGILKSSTMESFSGTDLLEQFRINSVGPLITARVFLPRISEHGKIGFLTSRMGSISDNSSGGYYGYRMSKTALNMGAMSMAKELENRNITVLLLHPGYVRTDMTGGQGEIDPPQAVEGLLEIMNTKSHGETGSFWHTNGERLPW